MRLMARMPQKMKDQQYLLLERIGKIKELIDLAADRKDSEFLMELEGRIIDPNLRAHIN